ncbi:hypothetical protein QBC35DRAFT_172648 [Podospora australis]|uniref:Uncharacterized protein n=1 Tax=Podospora australis TaxID=1536484 RepID=A0AAN7AE14_9PEZI|nr:hypothetical protein QBC35DRAFT_172648 [Podospora australis]
MRPSLFALVASVSLALAQPGPEPSTDPSPTVNPIAEIAAREERRDFEDDPEYGRLASCASSYRALLKSSPTPVPRAGAFYPRLSIATSKTVYDGAEMCTQLHEVRETPPPSLQPAFSSWWAASSAWKVSAYEEGMRVAKACSTFTDGTFLAGEAIILVATDVEECKFGARLGFGLITTAGSGEQRTTIVGPGTITSTAAPSATSSSTGTGNSGDTEDQASQTADGQQQGGAVSSSSSAAMAPGRPRETGYVLKVAVAVGMGVVGAVAAL